MNTLDVLHNICYLCDDEMKQGNIFPSDGKMKHIENHDSLRKINTLIVYTRTYRTSTINVVIFNK